MRTASRGGGPVRGGGARVRKASAVVRRGKEPRRARKSYVWYFGRSDTAGRADMRDLLGGKGANLGEMASLGIPVPAGFTITTEVCTHAMEHGGAHPPELAAEVARNLARIEREMGRRFGDPADPLLLSVRSGARASMPGMMDTVLNLGLNPATVEGLIRKSGNARFAYDCYRRFIQMFGEVVLGVKAESATARDPFEHLIEKRKTARGVSSDAELDAEDLRALAEDFRSLVERRLGKRFPEDPQEQLWQAIGAVFGSWDNARAASYRKLHGIPSHWGTAVKVQAMVFGNLGDDCATGVAFTRNPATADKGLYGEFLANAQGEDVVAGIRTPQQITNAASRESAAQMGIAEAERRLRLPSLEESMLAATASWSRSRSASSDTSATCRISSSRSSTAACGCCRPALASAPRRPRCRPRSTWSRRA